MLLDVMLPSLDGFDVLRNMRRTLTMPVIMLTARGADLDRIQGLELGADDYLPKPFNPRELVARIRAILRRTASGAEHESNSWRWGRCKSIAQRLRLPSPGTPCA